MIIRVDNNPREMHEQEDQYWRHVLSGDPMFKNFLSREASFGQNPYEKAMNQPICPKCERAGFHHKGGMACGHCSYMGPTTHNLKIYLKEEQFKS